MWQTSDTLTLNIAFKPIVTLDVFKSSTNMMRLPSRSPASLNLYRDDDDVWFRCAYRANPSDSDRVTVVWKLNGQIQEATSTAADFHRSSDLFAWKSRSSRLRDSPVVNVTCEVENSVGKGVFNARITQLCKLDLTKTIHLEPKID